MSKTWKIINGVRPLFYFRAVRYAGGYPVVVVSQNAMNRHLETVVICLIAASGMEPGMEKQIFCAGRETEIGVDQILTISRTRLRQKIETLSKADASRLRRLITEIYGEAL